MIPQQLQASTDIQVELDRVANDIEMYLIYQLEKVIQGKQNDVEKMHIFHENFKTIKPKIIQILYSLKTRVKNPISGIFFTSHSEEDQEQTDKTIQHNQTSYLYQTKIKSYFYRKILSTINQNTSWQPSKKLQQTALIWIALLAWSINNLSLSQTLISPIQKNIQYLFDGDKASEKSDSDTALLSTSTGIVAQSSNLSTTEKKTSPVKSVTESPTSKVWNPIKQEVDAAINTCNIYQSTKCLAMATTLLDAQKASTLTSKHIKTLLMIIPKISDNIEASLLNQSLSLDTDQLEEIGYLIKKLSMAQSKLAFAEATQTVMNHLHPNFSAEPAIERIKASQPAAKKACLHLTKIHKINKIDGFNSTQCETILQSNIINQAFDEKINTFEKSLHAHMDDQALETLLKKTMYMQNHTKMIAESMKSIAQELKAMENFQASLNQAQKQKLAEILSASEKFDETVYKKVLQKVSQLSKEIIASKNMEITALQVLETLVQNTATVWPKKWEHLDNVSQNSIKALEKIIIKIAGQYLNESWSQMIAVPYNEELRNTFLLMKRVKATLVSIHSMISFPVRESSAHFIIKTFTL